MKLSLNLLFAFSLLRSIQTSPMWILERETKQVSGASPDQEITCICQVTSNDGYTSTEVNQCTDCGETGGQNDNTEDCSNSDAENCESEEEQEEPEEGGCGDLDDCGESEQGESPGNDQVEGEGEDGGAGGSPTNEDEGEITEEDCVEDENEGSNRKNGDRKSNKKSGEEKGCVNKVEVQVVVNDCRQSSQGCKGGKSSPNGGKRKSRELRELEDNEDVQNIRKGRRRKNRKWGVANINKRYVLMDENEESLREEEKPINAMADYYAEE